MAWAGATPTNLTSGAAAGTISSATTASVTLTAGRLYLIYLAARRGDSIDFVAPTSVVRGAQSFAITDATEGKVITDPDGGSRRGAWMGYCIPGSTTTGTVVITFADSYTDISWAIVEISSGFDSGAPLLQVKNVSDTDGTGTTTTLTFASGMASNSLVVAGSNIAGDVSGITQGSGYTELTEVGLGGVGLATAYNTSPDTTYDFSYAVGEVVGGIAVEVKATAGGATVGGPLAGGKLAGGFLAAGRLAH